MSYLCLITCVFVFSEHEVELVSLPSKVSLKKLPSPSTMALHHNRSVALYYGLIALFVAIIHNVFLLYHVETFVSIYKIDKFSFWAGEIIFLIWNSCNDPLFGWLSDKQYLIKNDWLFRSDHTTNSGLVGEWPTTSIMLWGHMDIMEFPSRAIRCVFVPVWWFFDYDGPSPCRVISRFSSIGWRKNRIELLLLVI